MNDKTTTSPASPQPTKKKPFYKKWWVWVIAFFVIVVISAGGRGGPTTGEWVSKNGAEKLVFQRSGEVSYTSDGKTRSGKWIENGEGAARLSFDGGESVSIRFGRGDDGEFADAGGYYLYRPGSRSSDNSSSRARVATVSADDVVKAYAKTRGISIGQLQRVNDQTYGFRNSGNYQTFEIMGFITGTSTSITQLVEVEKDSSGEWSVNRTKTY